MAPELRPTVTTQGTGAPDVELEIRRECVERRRAATRRAGGLAPSTCTYSEAGAAPLTTLPSTWVVTCAKLTGEALGLLL